MTGKPVLTALVILIPYIMLPLCAENRGHCSFSEDPLCFHENLRRRSMEGIENREILEELHKEYHEHSFDGLLISTPKGNAGFILLYSAWLVWGECRYDEALSLYSKARQLFLEAGMESESRFCLYYMSRIVSEQENFRESIRLLNQALEEGSGLETPYLEGLVNESLGYDLWYMDKLPESCESFGRAADLWSIIEYEPGMVNCWNNLGLLFQELDLPDQAWMSYETAISSLREDTFPEIKFHLYRNCALFHFRNNNRTLAREYLLNCRDHRECGETLYQLARAEILEQPEILEGLNPETPSMAFVRDLLRARFRKKEGDHEQAIALVEKVIRDSREADLPRHTREASLALAEILEKEGRTAEARAIFSKALEKDFYLKGIDVILPFSKSAARQLNGLVRCLAVSGGHEEARETIHQAALLKTRKGFQLLEQLKNRQEGSPGSLLSRAVLPMERDDLPFSRQQEAKVPPAGATLLEFWPDGKEVFAWIDNPDSHHFLRLELDDWLHDTLHLLTSSLYSRKSFLPPEPPAEISEMLYGKMFLPLEHLIKSERLVIIAHKDLQALPFEMLRNSSGEYLLEKYTFSYLPGRHFLGQSDPVSEPPVLICPREFKNRNGPGGEQRQLQALYPDLRVDDSLDIQTPLSASWIHIASHLRLDRRYWLNSALTAGSYAKPMADLLQKEIRCTLLSLGVCESANSATGASPYWMGFSEIFMLNGAGSLLTSRWSMDELSSSIYTEFFRLCKKGLPMDEALRKSRLKFLDPEKSGLPPQVSHPFYWAGITYVGEPGETLPGYGNRIFLAGSLPLIFWMAFLAGVIFRDEIRIMFLSGITRREGSTPLNR